MTNAHTGGNNETQGKTEQRRLMVDTAGAATSYANTCHVASTKEELVLNFGLNQSWEQGQPDLRVQVTNRIILSPFAAKRLALLLGAVVQQYEGQFGVLDLGVGAKSSKPATTGDGQGGAV